MTHRPGVLRRTDPESAGRQSGMNTARSIIAMAWNDSRVTRLGSFSDGSGHRSEGLEQQRGPRRRLFENE